jgi:hypothetical protein
MRSSSPMPPLNASQNQRKKEIKKLESSNSRSRAVDFSALSLVHSCRGAQRQASRSLARSFAAPSLHPNSAYRPWPRLRHVLLDGTARVAATGADCSGAAARIPAADGQSLNSSSVPVAVNPPTAACAGIVEGCACGRCGGPCGSVGAALRSTSAACRDPMGRLQNQVGPGPLEEVGSHLQPLRLIVVALSWHGERREVSRRCAFARLCRSGRAGGF